MARTGDAQVRISLIDRLTGPISRLQARLGAFAGASGLGRVASATGNLTRSVANLTAGMSALAGISAGALGYRLVGGVIETGAAFERFETILTTIEGSADKARTSLAWITDFAATTPYELQNVTDAFVRLRAYGIDPTDGTLSILGDTAAAMGKDVMEAVEMIADAQTGEFERLKEFGLRGTVEGNIATIAFTDAQGVQRTLQAARDDSAAIREAVLEAFRMKGFEGAMDDLSRTWGGMVSNLMDQWTLFLRRIADAGTFDYVKDRLQELLDTLGTMAEDGRLQAWAQRISDALVGAFRAIETRLRAVDWAAAWQGVQDFFTALGEWRETLRPLTDFLGGEFMSVLYAFAAVIFGPVLAAVASFGAAVISLGVAIMATPVGWILAAVAAIGAAVYLMVRHWDELPEIFAAVWDGVKDLAGRAYDTAAAWVVSLWEGFKARWPEAAAWVQGAATELAGWWDAVDLFDRGRAILQSLHAGLIRAWSTITVWVTEAVDAFTSWWSGDISLVEAGRQVLAGYWEGLKIPWPGITSWVEEKIADFRSWWAAIDLFAIGQNIVGSLWRGFQSMWDGFLRWLEDSINGALSKIPAWVQSGLGMDGLRVDLVGPALTPSALPGPAGAPSAAMPGPGQPGYAGFGAETVEVQSETRIDAPVAVTLTVNGLAEIEVFRREAEALINRAMRDWAARQASEAQTLLSD